MAGIKEELKSLLMRMKEESENADLKLNIQEMKIMASSPISSRQIEGGKVEADFIFLGSKITTDGERSHEIKRHLLLGRKAMSNLDSILKSGDITLRRKIHLVSYDFSNSYVQMSELDHWLIGKDSDAGKE